MLGSDVWLGGAEDAAREAAEALRLPVIANGQARGVLPRGHELLVTRARSVALRQADLVIVAGTPLDFRLGYGSFGPEEAPAQVVHVADAPGGIATHVPLAASAAGDLSAFFTALAAYLAPERTRTGCRDWPRRSAPRWRLDGPLLASDADPVHPARIYGELLKVLDDDAVVIGDGGDFVSFAGKYIEPKRPGGWLDPGPFGCLGTGLGYAIAARLARPSAQVVLLLGDGAAGFSLMDADTLVRHRLPVVIVCGNNAGWGLETASHARHLRLRRRRRPAAGVPLRRGGARPRRCRRTRHRGRGHRSRAAPRLRLRRPVPGQRGHRPRGRLPALDHRGVAGAMPLTRPGCAIVCS